MLDVVETVVRNLEKAAAEGNMAGAVRLSSLLWLPISV